MTRTLLVAIFALSLRHCHAQGASKGLSFDVASIKICPPGTPEPPGEHDGSLQLTFPGGRFEADATTLEYIMEWAYDIQRPQHSASPSWIGSDRYQIIGKAGTDVSDEQMKAMVRTLLAARFQLKLHPEKKEMSAFVMSVGKSSPKLLPAKDGEACSIQIRPRMLPEQKTPSFQVTATRYSLNRIASTFVRHMGLDTVLINQTGLNGEFDFTLDLQTDEAHPNPLDPGILMEGLRNLGLTVKSQKAMVDFLAIEGVERPSGN
jgi:uncharacterized protein (TIGR03435 family)